MLKKAFLLAVIAFSIAVTAIPASAATKTKIYTNRSLGFSLKYNAKFQWSTGGCDNAHNNIFFQLNPSDKLKLEKTQRTYDIGVQLLNFNDDGCSFAVTIGPKLRKTLRTRGWASFISQYIKEVVDPNPFESVAVQAYGLNGYTATIITTHEKGVQYVGGTVEHHILVTSDKVHVYDISDQLYSPNYKKIFSPNPYAYDFRALAQSFRIL